MYEFHGWATLREAAGEDGEDDQERALIMAEVRDRLNGLLWAPFAVARLDTLNGEHHLSLSGMFNHPGERAQELFDLLQFVTTRAPGSYGLMYVRDDEADDAQVRNHFQVLALSRGEVRRQQDPFLSPYFPTIEDNPA